MGWTERLHPRERRGTPIGGRFAFKSGPAAGMRSSRGGAVRESRADYHSTPLGDFYDLDQYINDPVAVAASRAKKGWYGLDTNVLISWGAQQTDLSSRAQIAAELVRRERRRGATPVRR